jgi:alpha-beta hydrolase superfamily lysophospholipase
MKKVWYFLPPSLFVYGAICAGYYFLQEKIIFLPVKLSADYQFSFKNKFTEYNLQTPDNQKINTILFHHPNPKGLIVYCHGNADNIVRWGQIAENLVHFGYEILIYDYRGYGKSTGTITENNLFEDAQMVYELAKQRFSEKQIIVYGRSLGTGIATFLAATNQPKQLILETPYYSILEMSQRYASWLPTKLLLKYPLRTDLRITDVQAPITIFHGTADEVVPYDSGLKLKKLLKPTDEFITIPKGMHGDLELFDEYKIGIAKILK